MGEIGGIKACSTCGALGYDYEEERFPDVMFTTFVVTLRCRNCRVVAVASAGSSSDAFEIAKKIWNNGDAVEGAKTSKRLQEIRDE